MYRKISCLALIVMGCHVNAHASASEHIPVSMGELKLKPRVQMAEDDMTSKPLRLPELCSADDCKDVGVLSLSNGTIIPLQSGLHLYPSGVSGWDVGVRLNNENATSLRRGKGGVIDVVMKQAQSPYDTGAFNYEALKYQYQGASTSGEVYKATMVSIAGIISAGSCNIVNGTNLDFNFVATNTELNTTLARDGKRQVQQKSIEFECVNVNTITMKFNSGSLKRDKPVWLFDKETGVNLSLGYEANGRSGEVRWDNTPFDVPVVSDKAQVYLNLFVNKGSERISAGQFTFVGTYTAEYN